MHQQDWHRLERMSLTAALRIRALRRVYYILYNPFGSPLQTESLISFIITSISFVRGHTIGTKPHYSFVLCRCYRQHQPFERLLSSISTFFLNFLSV